MSWIFGTCKVVIILISLVNNHNFEKYNRYLEYGEEGEAELAAFYRDIGKVKEVDLEVTHN